MKQSQIKYRVATFSYELSYIDSMWRIIKFESHSKGYFIVNKIHRDEKFMS